MAANALGVSAFSLSATDSKGRLGQSRSTHITQHLINVILEWAKALCFTSNGNYLCQQLLEKGTTEDRISFIKVIQ